MRDLQEGLHAHNPGKGLIPEISFTVWCSLKSYSSIKLLLNSMLICINVQKPLLDVIYTDSNWLLVQREGQGVVQLVGHKPYDWWFSSWFPLAMCPTVLGQDSETRSSAIINMQFDDLWFPFSSCPLQQTDTNNKARHNILVSLRLFWWQRCWTQVGVGVDWMECHYTSAYTALTFWFNVNSQWYICSRDGNSSLRLNLKSQDMSSKVQESHSLCSSLF